MRELGKKNQQLIETVEAFYCSCVSCSPSSCSGCSCYMVGNRASLYTATSKAANASAQLANNSN